MSRTDKDRPYWVKLNDEGTLVNHNHQHFGRSWYVYRPVRDERGNRVYEDVPVYRTAYEVVHGWDFTGVRGTYGMPAKAVNEAKLLLSAGRPDEPVLIDTKRRVKFRRVQVHETYNHCTAGQRLANKYDAWVLPCTPELPAGNSRKMYTCGLSKARKGYSDMRNGASRRAERDMLRSAARGWNCGEDLDNFDSLENLTAQHRHSMAWDLY